MNKLGYIPVPVNQSLVIISNIAEALVQITNHLNVVTEDRKNPPLKKYRNINLKPEL